MRVRTFGAATRSSPYRTPFPVAPAVRVWTPFGNAWCSVLPLTKNHLSPNLRPRLHCHLLRKTNEYLRYEFPRRCAWGLGHVACRPLIRFLLYITLLSERSHIRVVRTKNVVTLNDCQMTSIVGFKASFDNACKLSRGLWLQKHLSTEEDGNWRLQIKRRGEGAKMWWKGREWGQCFNIRERDKREKDDHKMVR